MLNHQPPLGPCRAGDLGGVFGDSYLSGFQGATGIVWLYLLIYNINLFLYVLVYLFIYLFNSIHLLYLYVRLSTCMCITANSVSIT